MDTKAGRDMAKGKGICLHIGGGATCGRPLRRGKCRLHKDDIYTADLRSK